jgi:hypothetical protein
VNLDKVIKIIKESNAASWCWGKPMDHCVSCGKQATLNYNAITRDAGFVALATNSETGHTLWSFVC